MEAFKCIMVLTGDGVGNKVTFGRQLLNALQSLPLSEQATEQVLFVVKSWNLDKEKEDIMPNVNECVPICAEERERK